MPKRSWRRKTMQISMETGQPQESDPSFKVAMGMQERETFAMGQKQKLALLST
jgi:hypothetical protein